MRDSADNSGWWKLIAVIFTVGFFDLSAFAFAGVFDGHPYEHCAPTEVYAWRADTEIRESGWQCTPVADLVTER